uniref:Ig-like domain-containing protein n=1 Tax=Kryptolebias marmoratus TaxID=37003 RepID=A0A3Q3APA0_KRYMA
DLYPRLTFLLSCLSFQANDPNFYTSLHQWKDFVSVNVGDSLTLQCFYEDVVDARFYWYRQNLGQKLKLISTFYKYEKNGTFHDEFKNNPRFTLDTKKGKNHLKITNLSISDSATYYCASSYLYRFEFAEGTTVTVKGSGSNIQTLVHQSVSETVHSGGSVILNCTVQTGTCDGEQSVYWFTNSEESHPGLIYTHGSNTLQCERKPSKQTCSCNYTMSIKNLNQSHAWTYYCAVVSCGHILFGKETKLDLVAKYDFLTYNWSGAFTCTSILSVLLAFSVCLMNRANSCRSSSRWFLSTFIVGYQGAENYYAALVVRTNRSRKPTDPVWSECVYFKTKQHK